MTKRLLAESRLVTLTGPGGVGKTRLALRVAGNMRRAFRDKVWCVQLEDLRDPALLPEAVIDQLGLGGASSGDNVDAIVERLKNRELLLILDNCEQIVEATAEFVENIIRWCPGVRVLATSTQSLGVAGESTLVVPPLQVPDIEHLPSPEAFEQYASVRLFMDRARAAVPEFELDENNGPALMRLCYYLDGNPLAIELAAVRLRSLTPQQIESRLAERYELLTGGHRGAPPRQQSLRALIDWSYSLCSDQDKIAWARISMFSGSFNLAAAEFVAGDGMSKTNVLTAMHSLVDKSILIRDEDGGEVRFRLLHSLRVYGQEKLVSFGEYEEIRNAHLRWYERVLRQFAREWISSEQVAWVNKISLEQANLRVALDSALHTPDNASRALRMTQNLSLYWTIRGLNSEARHWLDLVLSASPTDTRGRASGLRLSAWLALLQGDPTTATPLLDEAMGLAQRYEDPLELAFVNQTRGMAAFFRGDLSWADDLLSDSLAQLRDKNMLSGELLGLFGLGMVRGLNGDFVQGIDLLNRAITLSTEHGELFWRSHALWASAYLEVGRNHYNKAETLAKDSLRLQRRLNNRMATAFTMDTLAWVAEEHGRSERAAKLFGAAAATWDALRTAPAFYATFEAGHNAHVERTRRALGEQAYQQVFDQGYALSSGAAQDFAMEVKERMRGTAQDNVHQMPLTRREQEIAELVTHGRTNKEIAETLVIAQRTVEGHVQHILTKLDFTSRAQIAGWIAGQRGGEQRAGT